jgi:hypothetical protein
VPPPSGLDEVERALSILEGRHPEHERIRRETMAAAEERGHALAKDLAASARRRRRRAAVTALAVVALGAAGWVGWRVVSRARVIRAALDAVEAPFVSGGMKEIASNELSASRTLETNVPGSSCFIAVASSGDVRVHAGDLSLTAPGSVGWCACGAGHATVEAVTGDGVALLRVDARSIGGPLARPWVQLKPSAWGDGGGECADAALDDWLADHKWPPSTPDEHWLDASPARTSLRHMGWRVVSGVEPGRPFGLVESAPGDCTLVVAGPEDELSLRATGGKRRITHARGAMAFCASVGETTTVWRDGPSNVVVLSAPAPRVGGLLGTRECADATVMHIPPEATWLRDEDLGWDAAALLRVSALAGVTTVPMPTEPGATSGEVTALSLSSTARVASEPSGVIVACDPLLQSPPLERTSVCAAAAPVSWWRRTDAPAGLAHAPLPFWLSMLESHHEPDAIARIPELLTLARRLTREGFVPTTLESVTELEDGIRVIGRAGEDQVVAVGLGPKPPWAFPYTDGVPWDVGDPPRVVDLKPGLAIKLHSTPPSNAPLEKRRTVVFRHTARP